MKQSKGRSWLGLYALIPVTTGLLYAAFSARVAPALHVAMLIAIVVVVPLLALGWSERHADLLGAEGVNARAEEDALKAAGIRAGRFAPSQTARQAQYRRVMLARDAGRPKDRAHGDGHSM